MRESGSAGTKIPTGDPAGLRTGESAGHVQDRVRVSWLGTRMAARVGTVSNGTLRRAERILGIFTAHYKGEGPTEALSSRRWTHGRIGFHVWSSVGGFEGTIYSVATSMSTRLPLETDRRFVCLSGLHHAGRFGPVRVAVAGGSGVDRHPSRSQPRLAAVPPSGSWRSCRHCPCTTSEGWHLPPRAPRDATRGHCRARPGSSERNLPLADPLHDLTRSSWSPRPPPPQVRG
jgi:hypothetical protein